MGATRSHSTPTSTARWSGPKAEANFANDTSAATLRKAFAWADPDGDPSVKATYKFIHHEVGRDGKVGAANVRACTSGIGVLNGARGGADIPARDRPGVWRHLARHLRDAGVEPAPLKE